MTDLMKLATDYAQACYHLDPHSYDPKYAAEARAALQSAIEALQAENERLIQEQAAWRSFTEMANNTVSKAEAERDALAAKLVPLTGLQADEIALDVMGFAVLDKEQKETALMLIRATERAHGIQAKGG